MRLRSINLPCFLLLSRLALCQRGVVQIAAFLHLVACMLLVATLLISERSHAAPPTGDFGTAESSKNVFVDMSDRPDGIESHYDFEPAYKFHCATLRQQLSQLTGVLVQFNQLNTLRDVARAGELGLVGLLGNPPQDLAVRIANLQALSPAPVFFASDEESRSVQRLESLIYQLPGTRSMVRAGAKEVTRIFREYGARMRALGLHISFSPVADLGRGPGIGYRSFGTDVESVTTMVNAVTEGFISAGVLPVIKHFPGHGLASADTHDTLATTPPLQELSEQMTVFAHTLNRDVAVMVGHLVTPQLTQGQPASLSSPAINGLLRQSLGFDGLVITDALGMSAITNKQDQAIAGVKAIQAGADIALVSTLDAQQRMLDRLEQAVDRGDLSRTRIAASLERVLAAKISLIAPGTDGIGAQRFSCSDSLHTSQSP